MEQVTAYKQSDPKPQPPRIDTSRILIGILGSLLTLLGLYAGFIYLRDSKDSRLIIGIVAIVWGVGGVASLFFMANWIVESLPSKWTTRIQPYIFVGPAAFFLIVFLALPVISTVILSFKNADGTAFVGFQNYIQIFSQRIMIEAWRNNLLWLVIGTPLVIGLGLLIAILADRSKFERVAKSLIFMPMAISMVGAGIIWKFVFDVNPNVGLINAAVTSAGGTNQDWLRLIQPWNNIFLIIVMVWLQTGFAMVLISAAIKGVDGDLLEAARVDGASEITIFLRIIIPSIRGTLITVTTTTIIFTLKIFDIVVVMTGGQFGTEVIGVRFFREMFTEFDQGLGSAIAVVLLLAVIPVMIYNLRQFSQRETF
ncbi:MAG: sugar ABC transporter permease [Anaerolineae bacterium]|nr:sugar ABC transporter permease [Anaerolineae bacterium]